MPDLLRMPEIAAGTDHATLVLWPVAVGERFVVPDVIAVVETDKASVDVEAERAGTLVRTLVEPGSEVQVGEPIALVAADGETIDDVDAALRALGFEPAGESRAAGAATVSPAAQPTPAPSAAGAPPPPASAAPQVNGHQGRIFASPLTRRLAREAGVGLEELHGSGPGGRIVRRDIERFLEERSRAGVVPAAPTPQARPTTAPAAEPAREAGPPVLPTGVTAVPHTKLRRLIATRLTESKSTIPHFYVKAGIEVDELLALRAQLNAAAGGGVKISVNDFVIKAMAVAHVAVPAANVIWTEDALHQFDHVDIAVAVAAPNGLITPVVRGVETMSISALSRTVQDLVGRAGAGRLQQVELVGGSTTVSNLGMFGVDEFSAIINPPHSSILAVGAIAQRPVVLDTGELAARSTMNVVLSVDHRAVDGALAAEWMRAFANAIRNPLTTII